MMTPASNTHQAWLTERTQKFAKAETLEVSMSHTLFAEPDPANVETLDIDIEVRLRCVLYHARGQITDVPYSLTVYYWRC